MRIRSIKPEFWRSSDVSALDLEDRLLYVGLWSYVDDNGVGLDRLSLITADLFADDLERDSPETLARVSRGLSNLFEATRIWRYKAENWPLLYVLNWDKHQRVDKPNKQRFPRPDIDLTRDYRKAREGLATSSRHSRETLAPGAGEQGSRGTVVNARASTARTTKKRATQLPDDWSPTDSHKTYAAEHDLDVDHEASQFRNHHTSRGSTFISWDAAFRTWLGNATKWSKTKPGYEPPANLPEWMR